jgi:hypothetical protein
LIVNKLNLKCHKKKPFCTLPPFCTAVTPDMEYF